MIPSHPSPPISYGQLYADMESGVDGRLTGKVPADAIRIFSAQDHTAPSYTRNASFWAADLVAQWTALSPWNSGAAFQKAGVLVSPRHVLFATHYAVATSDTIRFVKADDTVVTRTITGIQSLTTTDTLYPDLTVALLDSDVDSGISFLPIMPLSAVDKMPSFESIPLPVVTIDQEEKATLRGLHQWPATTGVSRFGFAPTGTNANLRNPYYETLVGGDSGSPTVAIVGDTVALLCLITYGGSGQGTWIAAHKTEINAAMNSLGGGYQLTELDLSSYPDV